MSIISCVDLSTASQFRGMTLKTKYNGKKHNVYFKLVCDDYTLSESIRLASGSSNILMVEYQGMDTNPMYRNLKASDVYVGRVTDFGNNLTEADLELILEDTPEGVTPIVRLQSDFSDLHLLWQLSKKFPRVRFCGGKLFGIEGVKCGVVGIDVLDKAGVKYDESSYFLSGTDDVLDVVSFTDLTIETSAPKADSGRPKKSGTKKEPAKKKPQLSFASIMSSQGTVLP